jgi:hypothetical protein
MSIHTVYRFRRILCRFTLPVIAGALLVACSSNQNSADLADTSAFRLDRFRDMERAQNFDRCAEEGLMLDAEARSRASAGAFLGSARVLSGCIDDIAPSADAVPQNKRMRIHALAAVNYFKGGDVEATRRSFETFKANYPDRDLYLGNNISFVETANVLLGRTEDFRLGQFSVLNVDENLKREIRRIDYWKNR